MPEENEEPKQPEETRENPEHPDETRKPDDGVSTPEDLEAIKAELEEEKKAKATAEAALAEKDARIAELEALSGVTGITDLHRHLIDQITIPCSQCEGTMHRVPEVLDCWFESGSMPYGQVHYPF